MSLVSSPFVKDTWASSQWRKVRREVLRREVVMSHWVDRQWSTSLRPKRLPWAESQLPLTCFNVPPHWPEPPALATCPPLPPLNCGVSPPTELTTSRSQGSIRHPGRSTPAFSRWIWTCWPLTSLGSGTGEGGQPRSHRAWGRRLCVTRRRPYLTLDFVVSPSPLTPASHNSRDFSSSSFLRSPLSTVY